MLPQGSSFGICKAELFGEQKGKLENCEGGKTNKQTNQPHSRRIRQTDGHKIQGASQTSPAFQLHGGHPTAKNTTHSCSTLR